LSTQPNPILLRTLSSLHNQRKPLTGLYRLFEFVNQESSKYEALKQFNLVRQDIFSLLSIPPPQRTLPRIQLNSDVIGWINNLEQDDMYARWPRSVNDVRPPLPYFANVLALLNSVLV